jgi:hypothetical protein
MIGTNRFEWTGSSADDRSGSTSRSEDSTAADPGSDEQTVGARRARVDRGQAEQLDFLNGMIILLFGVGLFFAGGSVLFSIGVDSSPDREGAALNADQRLVEDLLVSDIRDTELDRQCAEAYFGMNESGVCTRAGGLLNDTWSEQRWLRHSLGLETELHVNVTIVDSGSVVTSNGTEYSLGPSPPPDVAVFESNRFVTFGDGEYQTAFVRVW